MARGRSSLVDGLGRVHDYLRVSVTDRCNLRCRYCMPEEGVRGFRHEDVLRYEEITHLVRLLVGAGVRRVRLTGGEPLVRAGLPSLVESLAALGGLTDLSLTTNGQMLEEAAPDLRRAGLQRVNVSLDSMDPERFRFVTRRGDVHATLRGVEAAIREGLTPVKVNMVVMEGTPEEDVLDLVRWCAARPHHLVPRFIELMPFGTGWGRPAPMMNTLRFLSRHMDLQPALSEEREAGPARYYTHGDLQVGFITPLTDRFCDSCNRLRLTSDGRLLACLSSGEGPSLRDILRGGGGDDDLLEATRRLLSGKEAGHGCSPEGLCSFKGAMSEVGG